MAQYSWLTRGVEYYHSNFIACRTMTMSSEELTVPEAAEYLHVNPETVRRNIWQKRLPAIQRGRQLVHKQS